VKDKRAFIFYFLMSIIFWDFGNQIRKISYNSFFENFNNPIFSIVHVNNTGSAFSLFENNTLFLILFGVFAIGVVSFYVFKNISFEDKTALMSFTLFMGGTLGNLFERIQTGYVTDYIKLNFINFPVFNAFDIMICSGVFLCAIFTLFDFNTLKKEQNDHD